LLVFLLSLLICDGLDGDPQVLRRLKKIFRIASGISVSEGRAEGQQRTMDYAEYGGAPPPRVRGVCVIGPAPVQRQRRQERHPRRAGTCAARGELTRKIEQEPLPDHAQGGNRPERSNYG